MACSPPAIPPPGLEDLPPGLQMLLEAMLNVTPDDDSPPDDDGSGGDSADPEVPDDAQFGGGDFNGTSGDDDPILTLFAADGSVLATGVQNDFGETRIEFELTAGESYMVGIEPSGDGGTQYDLSSSYQVSTGSEDVSVIDTNELGA
jgi:hypothetical protein